MSNYRTAFDDDQATVLHGRSRREPLHWGNATSVLQSCVQRAPANTVKAIPP